MKNLIDLMKIVKLALDIFKILRDLFI